MNNELHTLADYDAEARARLSTMVYDYFSGGAADEFTLSRNRESFKRLALLPRVLVDVSRRSAATSVLGTPVSMPLLIAPTAFQSLAHPEGEIATARAAQALETLMILSTFSTSEIEYVASRLEGRFWFQLYVYRDREITKSIVERAVAAGARALVLTVDAPVIGRRERDIRNRFHLPDSMMVKSPVSAQGSEISGSELEAYVAQMLDPALSWRDLEWLQSIAGIPVVLKGVLRADDAKRAIRAGVQAIVVSNHGGRQLDTAATALDALPAIVDAVADSAEIYVDGGIRRGTDVIKALALGARAVLLGRPILWGLAADGADGVQNVLRILRGELDQAMALCGCSSLKDITRDLLTEASPAANRADAQSIIIR